MYGKLKIQMFVNLNSQDIHGRQTGKWVTLLTRYGLTLEESERTTREFLQWNPNLKPNQLITSQWIPKTEHIFID